MKEVVRDGSECVLIRGGVENDIANEGENKEAAALAVAVAVIGGLHGIFAGTVRGPEKGPGVDAELLDGIAGHCDVEVAVACV